MAAGKRSPVRSFLSILSLAKSCSRKLFHVVVASGTCRIRTSPRPFVSIYQIKSRPMHVPLPPRIFSWQGWIGRLVYSVQSVDQSICKKDNLDNCRKPLRQHFERISHVDRRRYSRLRSCAVVSVVVHPYCLHPRRAKWLLGVA